MSNQISVFDKVIKGEDSFTQLFVNFLRFPAFRNPILQTIGIDQNAIEVEFEDFQPQLSIGDSGRPDIILTKKGVKIYFEIKIGDTDLTGNQPTGYYNDLCSDRDAIMKGLVLIVPQNYFWIDEYKSKLIKIQKPSHNIFTAVMFWEEIIKIIEKQSLNHISPIFNEYVTFLNRRFHPYTNITLNDTKKMFDKNLPISIKRTQLFVDDLYKYFLELGYQVRRSDKKDWSEYGWFFTIKNDDYLFFGIWTEYWEKEGKPLCIAIDRPDEKTDTKFRDLIGKLKFPKAELFKKHLITYLNEIDMIEKESQQGVREKLSKIADEIGAIKDVK